MEEWAGVLGEIQFAKEFSLDPSMIPDGDGVGPVDFTLACGLTVDVKTSWWHTINMRADKGRLMVESGKVGSDVFVFAEARRAGPELAQVRLVGWAWDSEIIAVPAEYKYGKTSHRLPRASLHDIPSLREHSAFWQRQHQIDEDAQMAALIETQESFDGRTIVYRWWSDRTSVSVEVDGRRVGLVYCASKSGLREWYDVFDPGKRGHDTPRKALNAVIERVDGRKKPARAPRESAKQKAAASGWRQERDGRG